MVIIWIILGAVLFWKLQELLYARYWDQELEADICFLEESLIQGEYGTLEERVENRKFLPLPVLKVKFQVSRNLEFEAAGNSSIVTDKYYRSDVLSVRPYMRHRRKLTFYCKRRGFYRINEMNLVAGNLFLEGELPKTLPCAAQLYVYPRPYGEARFMEMLQKLNGEILSKRHLLEDPFEYRGIREYSPFDTMRDINWKATAKTGELKVNMKNYTALQTVRLLLNLEDEAIMRREELLEVSISMAAGIARMLLQEGIRISLSVNGRDIEEQQLAEIPAGAGTGHMESINRMLARIDLTERAPSFVSCFQERLLAESKEQAMFTIFISADSRMDFQELLAQCVKAGQTVRWICPCLSEATEKILPELEKFFLRVRTEEK